MKEICCEVFPEPGVDLLAGLEGAERASALRSLFERVVDFVRSNLLARPKESTWEPRMSRNLPFFRSLSGVFGEGAPLVFGYSYPFDPFQERIES